MADLERALPKTWQSPTMSPHCDDEKKYGVVDRIVAQYKAAEAKGEKIAGQTIRDLVTVNGVRVTLDDGTWGLVRASSNKPELVIVVESPVSRSQHARHLRRHRRPPLGHAPRSASTIRRSELVWRAGRADLLFHGSVARRERKRRQDRQNRCG